MVREIQPLGAIYNVVHHLKITCYVVIEDYRTKTQIQVLNQITHSNFARQKQTLTCMI